MQFLIVCHTIYAAKIRFFSLIDTSLLRIASHQRVEQIAGKDDEEGDGGEEDEYQPPGHHLFKQSGLGQGQAYDRHHEGNGRAEGGALCYKHRYHGDDAGCIGIHGHSKQHAQRNGKPVAARHVLVKKNLRAQSRA